MKKTIAFSINYGLEATPFNTEFTYIDRYFLKNRIRYFIINNEWIIISNSMKLIFAKTQWNDAVDHYLNHKTEIFYTVYSSEYNCR